jgi:5-methylcytosine-specific restriction endonuclease McrA
MFVVVATETGNGSRLIHGSFTPEGERRDLFAQFRFNGENLTWRFEIIRDVVTGGEYDWEANVCVPATAIHPGCLWTPAYTANSERLRRISSSTARHTRRLRIEAATSERFDPLDVFTRDEWICGLCNLPVDRALRWPDPLSPSLDHVIPLVAGGEHSQVNTQLAHWICNVRKGAREDWVAPKAAQ